MKQKNETDLLWFSDPPSAKRIVIFSTQEPAIGSMVCVESILNDAPQVGTLLSKMMAEPIFTDIEDEPNAGWNIFLREDTLFVRITSMQKIELNNTNHWLFNYPVLRDMTLMLMEDTGAKEVICVSSSVYSQENTVGLDDSTLLPLFSWLPAYIAKHEGVSVQTVVVGEEEQQILDAITELEEMTGLEASEDWAEGSYSQWVSALDEAALRLTNEIAKRNDSGGMHG